MGRDRESSGESGRNDEWIGRDGQRQDEQKPEQTGSDKQGPGETEKY